MSSTIMQKPNWKLSIGIPAFIFSVCIFICFSSVFHDHQTLLENAVLGDLLITAPIAYLFTIRKTNVSKTTVVRVFVIGLLLAGWILKNSGNMSLLFIKTFISPCLELFVLFFIGRKFYLANRKAKQQNKVATDFLSYSRVLLTEVLGSAKAGNIMASEISVFYYSFAPNHSKNIDYKTRFSNHMETGVLMILGLILSILLIETGAMHLLLRTWNTKVAWGLTAFSFYTCLQLFAHMRAITKRPILLNTNSLEIYNGLAGDVIIPYRNIEKVEWDSKPVKDKKAIKISLLKTLESHNCIIYLKEPVTVTKIYAIKKTTSTILLHYCPR
jgi:hypothetical protein